jgi:Domain of unknown function (DUF4326)
MSPIGPSLTTCAPQQIGSYLGHTGHRQFKALVEEGQLAADLSNPFRVGIHGDRATVIAKYERWLVNQRSLLRGLDELRGRDLVCWCIC